MMNMGILNILVFTLCIYYTFGDENKKHFVNEWAAEIQGGKEEARKVASQYGYTFVGSILPDIYLLRHSRVSKRSKYPSTYYHRYIAQHKNVIWLEQQVAKSRRKRFIQYQEFNDTKWRNQWYLNRGDGMDMNVQKAWAMGVTGKGVAVTILDDGIETEHPDLKRNYDEKASYDVNGHDPDPTPRYDYKNENRHGTRCAGEVAAQANNSECVVGAAYDARIGGVRMLDGDVTDSVEATSLGLNPQHIQIYSASWGPDDDGRTVDGPATLASKAFFDGVTRGRGGLGSIFVWASGNGGRDEDSCNCDGYTNSIYTLSISSVTESGKIPWYSEACSSTLATTYSSGSTDERQIMTTDIKKSCTETHTGTSASAPLAAGLCALALQANPMLTWRDLQHIVVMTAKPDYLHDPTWTTNGVARKVSHSFGYGLMDAAGMVELSRNWTTVPPQHICEIHSNDTDKPVPMNGKISVPLYTDGCEGTQYEVRYLEHVQARITLKASRRGDIQIYLTSPMGTRSTLLAKRSQDTSREGFNNWAFMTTHNWGELAKGQWVLVIENAARSFGGARLKNWWLVLYGTERNPQQPQTSSTTTTTTPAPTTTVKISRQRKHNPPQLSPYYRFDSEGISFRLHEQSKKPEPKEDNRRKYDRIQDDDIQKDNDTQQSTSQNNVKYIYNQLSPNDDFHPKNKNHMCLFETLAKQNNMTTRQYYQMMKKDLSSEDIIRRHGGLCTSHPTNVKPYNRAFLVNAYRKCFCKQTELKKWDLVLRGTASHPHAHNITPPANHDQPFTCSGIKSHGVCIECRPGFYKLKDGCVANCPEHYYGMMQMVQLRSTENTSNNPGPKFQRQGVCLPCHEACRTCKGSKESQCFQCTDGYEKDKGLCQKKLLLNFLDPDMLGFFVWVIVLCIAAIVLFGVIFGLLHARDRHLLCWKGKGKEAGKGDFSLTQEEIDTDVHNFDIIRNRNFRHASIPESSDPLCTVHVNQLENDIYLRDLTQSYRLDHKASRDNVARHSGSSSNRSSQLDRDSISVVDNNSSANRYSDHRKTRHSDRSSGRKYMDSYVTYDINSTLTQAMGREMGGKTASVGQGLVSHGQGHSNFHSTRSTGSLRHQYT
ncbi:furin-like isoform X2 [Mya arenaria]|uniref:furin-like isoform X2 n=1 Tax=Mya arenaria TaxID=6604 RepID=UPI0022E869F9|nr:furin-like isoform X2 [Mya arenaria]